jgi:hypothetical protein
MPHKAHAVFASVPPVETNSENTIALHLPQREIRCSLFSA